MDPIILAAHIQAEGNEKILDIGCGCAIMPFFLALKYPDLKITGIEIQDELALFAKKNILANKLEKKIDIINDNIKNIRPLEIDGKTDIIISNPPYKKKDSGRHNPNSQKAIARHEITLDIKMVFNCSNRLLKEQGRIYIIFPAERLSDLILAMANYNFSPDFIRFVHIKKNQPAKLVILCAKKNSTPHCIVRPPLYIYSSENQFSHEYISIFKAFKP